MKNQSLGSLINFAGLNKIIRSADRVWWYTDDGRNIVSDGHAIFVFHGDCDALFTRFKKLPGDDVLGSQKRGKDVETYSAGQQMKDSFGKFLTAEDGAEVHDTKLTYDNTKDKKTRVFFAQERDSHDYIFIGTEFFDCIGQYEKASAPRASGKVPVTFEGCYEEKAVILPVNTAKPAFLAEV